MNFDDYIELKIQQGYKIVGQSTVGSDVAAIMRPSDDGKPRFKWRPRTDDPEVIAQWCVEDDEADKHQ